MPPRKPHYSSARGTPAGASVDVKTPAATSGIMGRLEQGTNIQISRTLGSIKVKQLPKVSGTSNKAPFRVLIVGCGTGMEIIPLQVWLDKTLKLDNVRMLGIDVTENYIKQAKADFSHKPNIDFACVDASDEKAVRTAIDTSFKKNSCEVDLVVFSQPILTEDIGLSKLKFSAEAMAGATAAFRTAIIKITPEVLAAGGTVLGLFGNNAERLTFNRFLSGITVKDDFNATVNAYNTGVEQTARDAWFPGLHSQWTLLTNCQFRDVGQRNTFHLLQTQRAVQERANANSGYSLQTKFFAAAAGVFVISFAAGYLYNLYNSPEAREKALAAVSKLFRK